MAERSKPLGGRPQVCIEECNAGAGCVELVALGDLDLDGLSALLAPL